MVVKLVLVIGQESAFASKAAEDAQQKISLMEEHISKGQSRCIREASHILMYFLLCFFV